MDETPEKPRPVKPFEVGEDPRLRKRDVAGAAGTALLGSVMFILAAAAALMFLIFAVCAAG